MMKNRKNARGSDIHDGSSYWGGKPLILARGDGRFAAYYPFDCTALKIEREMWHAPRGRVLQSAQPSGYPHQQNMLMARTHIYDVCYYLLYSD